MKSLLIDLRSEERVIYWAAIDRHYFGLFTLIFGGQNAGEAGFFRD